MNEHGLAATATALPAAETSLAGCAAPAQLLVQDVLQRFDSVDKAADWALRRPSGGHASLLLADASGAVGAVEIDGRTRRVLGAGEAARVGLGPAAIVAALEKALAESRALDADSLARLLGEPSHASLVAVADPLAVGSASRSPARRSSGTRSAALRTRVRPRWEAFRSIGRRRSVPAVPEIAKLSGSS